MEDDILDEINLPGVVGGFRERAEKAAKRTQRVTRRTGDVSRANAMAAAIRFLKNYYYPRR